MHVLLFNLATDADDSVLGFTHRWIEELAARVERVTVVTMRRGRVDVPANVRVHSVGHERGWSEARRALEFWRLTAGITLRDRPDVAFAHMQPLFAAMYAPLARLRGVPVLLWYAHGAVPRLLKVADRLVDRSVTSTPAGYRLPSPKLHVIGQGVDVTHLEPARPAAADWGSSVITVGRNTASKHLDLALEGLARARRERPALRLTLFGEPATDADVHYEAALRERAARDDLAGAVDFAGPLRFDAIGQAHARGGIVLNLATGNSIDKALLEAAYAGCIPVSSNEVFAEIAAREGWDALVCTPDAADLSRALLAAADLTPDRRAEIAQRARTVIDEEHSLQRLMDLVAGHLRELADRRQP